MNTYTKLASAAAVVLALTVPPALAQSYSYTDVVMADHSMRTSKLIGLPVVNDQGQRVGTIVDILVKDKVSEPMVILSVGDFAGGGAKMVAAPLSHIKLEKTAIMMPGATQRMVASMPAYRFSSPLNGGGG